ncbi:MAG: N-terminal phage integrase SAM-like domain-containing protein, partial [Actinomycetota bacterium]|nr:N-terminal phage integrase SAM-like domain-containing protein [Actinomycetota bacterium]
MSNRRKRGNGEGGIGRRKNGGWYAQYYVPTADGGRQRRTISGKTRVEVAKKLAKVIADRDGGLVYDAGTLTVGEYLDRWLRDSVRDTVKDSTFASYRQLVRTHVKPALGRVKLEELSSMHVRGLLRQNLDAGLSPRTVQYVRFVLRR